MRARVTEAPLSCLELSRVDTRYGVTKEPHSANALSRVPHTSLMGVVHGWYGEETISVCLGPQPQHQMLSVPGPQEPAWTEGTGTLAPTCAYLQDTAMDTHVAQAGYP